VPPFFFMRLTKKKSAKKKNLLGHRHGLKAETVRESVISDKVTGTRKKRIAIWGPGAAPARAKFGPGGRVTVAGVRSGSYLGGRISLAGSALARSSPGSAARKQACRGRGRSGHGSALWVGDGWARKKTWLG